MEKIKIKPRMNKAITTVLKKCMGLKKTESCLIVADPPQRNVGTQFFQVACNLTDKATYMEVPTMKRSGTEPPASVAKTWKQYDVIVMTTSLSFSHTKARKNACKSGVKIATMPGLTEDMAMRALDINYNQLKNRSVKLAKIFEKGKHAKMTTKAGTNVEMSIQNKSQKAFTDYGIYDQAGNFGNLPAGESGLAPDEGTTNGIIVVDACMGTGKLKTPVHITIKNGFATKFESKDKNISARAVRKKFEGLGKAAFTVAEFAIGLNPKAKIVGINLEDEKVLGTAHMALGNNKSFGGTCSVQVHIDGIMKNPTVWIDNKIVMKDGKLKI